MFERSKVDNATQANAAVPVEILEAATLSLSQRGAPIDLQHLRVAA